MTESSEALLQEARRLCALAGLRGDPQELRLAMEETERVEEIGEVLERCLSEGEDCDGDEVEADCGPMPLADDSPGEGAAGNDDWVETQARASLNPLRVPTVEFRSE